MLHVIYKFFLKWLCRNPNKIIFNRFEIDISDKLKKIMGGE